MRRDPFGHWILVVVTFSLYGVVWIFLLARDANQLCGGARLDWQKHVKRFSAVFGLYLAGCVWIQWQELDEPMVEAIFPWMFSLAVGLTIYSGWMLVRIARMLRELNGTEKPTSGKVIVFSLLLLTSLPYLQSALNRALDGRSKPSS